LLDLGQLIYDWQDLGVGDDSAFDLAGFDRYVDEQGISDEDYPKRSPAGSPTGLQGTWARLEEVGTPSDLRATEEAGVE
jgi:hypothetical protein